MVSAPCAAVRPDHADTASTTSVGQAAIPRPGLRAAGQYLIVTPLGPRIDRRFSSGADQCIAVLMQDGSRNEVDHERRWRAGVPSTSFRIENAALPLSDCRRLEMCMTASALTQFAERTGNNAPELRPRFATPKRLWHPC